MRGFIAKVVKIDHIVLRHFMRRDNPPLLTTILKCFTYTASGGSGGILLGCVLFFLPFFHDFPEMRNYSYLLLSAILLNAIDVNLILKKIAKRRRPFNQVKEVELRVGVLTDYSFPSGHTSITTAITVILFYIGIMEGFGPWFFGIVAVYLLIMAYSRLYLRVHFLSDVLAGFLIGALNGCVILLFRNGIISLCSMFFKWFFT